MAVRGSASRLAGSALFADFPFLPGAETLLGREPPSVRELLADPAYDHARMIGRARILAAQDDPRGAKDIDELVHARDDERYLSFLFARLVLSAAPGAGALRRWAVAEAKRAHDRLLSVTPELLAGSLEEVARRLGVSLSVEHGRASVPVADYLRLATPIREADFRLASQELRRGQVVVAAARASRLLQEAVRVALAVPLALTPEVVRTVREGQAELLEEVARHLPAPTARTVGPAGPLRPDRFPPCIRKMQRTLEGGDNLSHAGRFCLAAFLHRAGASFETIVDAYRGAPDFEESITRYQVEHITLRDDGRGYEPPTCDTLRSHGLCARDGDPDAPAVADRQPDPRCFEESLKHPLQYYRLRGGTVTFDRDPAVTPAGAPGTSDGPGRPRSAARR